jgi:hypothetical protein
MLLVEESDGFSLEASPSPLFKSVLKVVTDRFTWARSLPVRFLELGLHDLQVEIDANFFCGGSPRAEFWRHTLQAMRQHFLDAGIPHEDLEAVTTLLQDPSFWTTATAVVSVSARR